MNMTSRLDTIADHLESIGQTAEAYQIDLVANTVDKMISCVNSNLGETLGVLTEKPSSHRHDFNHLIREYGVTDSPNDAGYILPDGNLLKRKIPSVGNGIDTFVRMGAIRMRADSSGIDFGIKGKPSEEQIDRMGYLLDMIKGPVTVNGKAFEKGTKPREITDYIKETFVDRP